MYHIHQENASLVTNAPSLSRAYSLIVKETKKLQRIPRFGPEQLRLIAGRVWSNVVVSNRETQKASRKVKWLDDQVIDG